MNRIIWLVLVMGIGCGEPGLNRFRTDLAAFLIESQIHFDQIESGLPDLERAGQEQKLRDLLAKMTPQTSDDEARYLLSTELYNELTERSRHLKAVGNAGMSARGDPESEELWELIKQSPRFLADNEARITELRLKLAAAH